MPPVKIHKVYVGMGGQSWPKPEFDPRTEVAKFEEYLAGVERRLGDVKFVGGQLVQNPTEAAQVATSLGDAAGVLLIHLSLGTGGMLGRIVDAGLPTVMFSQPFSGHEWMHVRPWQEAGKRVTLLATSDYGELDQAVGLLRVPARMRQSRIILMGRTGMSGAADRVQERLGAEVVPVGVDRLVEAHKAVDPKAAEAEAEQYWISPAKKIVEPSREEIVKSARMYLAMKDLLIKERAQAITIHCLGGIPIDVLGYPCLGFSKLNDLGLVGACEADVDSTLTMLMFAYGFRLPGFITDPLFDTSHNAVIHAHCTSATKMDGPGGKRAPFLIRTHRDDNKGASLEVEMRVGQIVTCAKLVNCETMLVSTGKITQIPDFEDRGCRTQITTQVADARKMLDRWDHGLHRVIFYGDHVQHMRHLAALLGLKVVEEG
jgi:hypothetical protein